MPLDAPSFCSFIPSPRLFVPFRRTQYSHSNSLDAEVGPSAAKTFHTDLV